MGHSVFIPLDSRRLDGTAAAAAPSTDAYGAGVAALLARAAALDALFVAHAQNVASLSVEVGRELDLPADEIVVLEYAAMVHDVGKLAVAPEVIAKPARLDAEEWAEMRRHAAIGADLLAGCDAPPSVVAAVRSHHERWDGHGYPDGLRAEEIPLAARVVAAADAYCAMLEHRSYRRARRPADARRELLAQAGKQFDAACAEATCLAIAAR